MQAIQLKCNLQTAPIGIDTKHPRFYWRIAEDNHNGNQTAYQLQVAASEELLLNDNPNCWDSGKVRSEKMIAIIYEGTPIEPFTKYFWRVGIWNEEDVFEGYSKTASFETAMFEESDWLGKWIGVESLQEGDYHNVPAYLYRKEITGGNEIESVRAYVCGLGYYEFYINGQKTSDAVLTSAFSAYDKTVYYDVLDVTNFMQSGQNVLSILVGTGFYSPFTQDGWGFHNAPWRHFPKVIAEIHVKYKNGEKKIIFSDISWKVAKSPITFNAIREGEFYDARMEDKSLFLPGYDDRALPDATIIRPPGGVLKSFQMPYIKVVERFRSASITRFNKNTFIYNVGQNVAGWVRIKVNGNTGQVLTIRYSEKINEDGSLDRSNLCHPDQGKHFQTDQYTLKGNGLEEWEPRFVYHGFQYVEISGCENLTLDQVEICRVNTDLQKRGHFSCNSEIINKIQQASVHSTIGNYHGIPTDCPHREKNGWTGDAAISAEQSLLNFDMTEAYRKWMQDFKDAQRPTGALPAIIPTPGFGYDWGSGPAWDSALVVLPWNVYLYTGDLTILEDMYGNIKRYVQFCSRMSEGYILCFGLGDWCPPNRDYDKPASPIMLTDTALYYHIVNITAQTAEILGKKDDAIRLTELAGEIKKAFREKFINFDTGIVEGNCQTSSAFTILLGLIDRHEAEPFIRQFLRQVQEKDGHIDCGILGAKAVFHVLSEYGHGDAAYEMATKKTAPSYGWWMEQGASTLWENWSGVSSRNHQMFSDISAWFYKRIAGINPDICQPGFKHIIFQPDFIRDVTSVSASVDSLYGTIESNIEININELTYTIVIPPTCKGTVKLPERFGNIVVNGTEIKTFLKGNGNKVEFTLPPGHHTIHCVMDINS